MKIDKDETARSLAQNYDDRGQGNNELTWLYKYGFKGFNNMNDDEIKTFIIEDCSFDTDIEDCGFDKKYYPEIIVYEEENQNEQH